MSSAIRRFLWTFSLCALLIPARSTFAGGPTHSVRFVNRCVQQVWLAELAPSTSDEVVPTRWALAPRCSADSGNCPGGCDTATGTCKCGSDAQCRFGAPAGTQTAVCSAGHCENSADLAIPEGWSGRFWPRTKCSGGSSDFTCKTGQCGVPGSLDCTTVNQSANRATLFEVTTGATGAVDNYDVSLVSGYNLPIRVFPLLPSDASVWEKKTPYADQAVITRKVGANTFSFNNVGSAGISGKTPPEFPAKRFAQVDDGPSIVWNNNGPSCEVAGCDADLRTFCPRKLQVKFNGATIACDNPADVCQNGAGGCGANATYYACKNYAGATDLFGNVLTLQSPNGESPVCFSPKDCQPGTTCLMNPNLVRAPSPALPAGAGICTPAVQNGGCMVGNEGTPCAGFPFVDYTCNTIILPSGTKTPVCMPPTTAGTGELIWNSKVWTAPGTTCTPTGGECSGSQQCLETNSVANGQKPCTATSGSCSCYNPQACSASLGKNDGCSVPDSCLNSDGVPDGGTDNGSTVDCGSTTTCYCSPQAIYSGTCGPTNANWLTAAAYPGVGKSSSVGFEKPFKNACPTSYAYQFDDSSSDWTCQNTADQVVNYRVVFCPEL